MRNGTGLQLKKSLQYLTVWYIITSFAQRTSKMAGRPRVFNEEDILNSAIDVFWAKGYDATTTEDLLQCMNLNKGSLYHAFGSKRDLFIRALDHFSNHSLRAIDLQIRSAETPMTGIRKFFTDLAAANIQVHLKGCFMGNTIAELASTDPELKDRAAASLRAMEDLFFKYLEAARKSKELKTKEDTRILARYLVTVWNGLNITRRIYAQKSALEPLIKMQLEPLH
jgi:TetR/AcrR family transcriptional regulator, transcriptional repressor for nem operon